MRPLADINFARAGRTLAVAMLAAALAGCGNERCRAGTALLTFTIDGKARMAQALVIRASVAGHDEASKGYDWHGASDGSVELTFKSGYHVGDHVNVTLYAERDNRLVGSGTVDMALTPGCSVLRVDVADLEPDGDGDGGAQDLGVPSGPCAVAGSDGTVCAPATNACQVDGRCLKGVCGPVTAVDDGTAVPGGQYIDRCCSGKAVKLNSDDNCGGCGITCIGFHCIHPDAVKEQQWWCGCNGNGDCWSRCCATGNVQGTQTKVCAPSDCNADTALCVMCPRNSICVTGDPHYYCEYPQ